MKFTIAYALPILAFPFVINARPSGREGPSALEHRDHGGESYRKRDGMSDIDILNFALTLEHLENKFYDEGLARYSQQDFVDAGYPEWTRGRYEQIAAHEKTHVEFLSSAITAAGAKAVEPCKYRFHDKDVNTFIDISFALESVGTSAYNGAAAFITDKAYLTVAASILGVEARQAAWINSAVRKSNPWNTAFETPLDMNQVYTLASAFIKSCPESNPPLPVKAFPTLTVPPTAEGEHAKLEFEAHEDHTQLYAAFLSGTGTIFVEINDKNEVLIPEGLLGLVFVLVTSDGGKVADESTVAGPTMLQFSFGSNGNVY